MLRSPKSGTADIYKGGLIKFEIRAYELVRGSVLFPVYFIYFAAGVLRLNAYVIRFEKGD